MKRIERLSLTSTFRSRTPTNSQTAGKAPNFVFDHSRQQRIVPAGRVNLAIHATQGFEPDGYRTTNRSGKPLALNAMVGGSPDYGGQPFEVMEKPKSTRVI